MRIVLVVDFRASLPVADAVAAIMAGWRGAAPADELTAFPPDPSDPSDPSDPPDPAGMGAALDRAGLAVVGVEVFDWSVLRDSLVTAVAGAAQERGLPCLVLAGAVSVGRREAAAIGVDAAYAVEPPGALTADALAELAERVARRWSRRSSISGG